MIFVKNKNVFFFSVDTFIYPPVPIPLYLYYYYYYKNCIYIKR